ncbi:MAG: hypothetical protein HOE82_06745 [Gammaproteobacteria bacterium]|jgi:hypothetical protein|nr:hypothetical protein [Gammaproteobacteria bacterium]
MSFAAERQSIEERLFDNWATTPIAFDNVDFDPPNASPWIKLNILNGSGAFTTMNNGKRYTGVIIIQVFGPKNEGTATMRTYADTLGALFTGIKFDDVDCDVASLSTIGTNKNWHQVNVTIPYFRNE